MACLESHLRDVFQYEGRRGVRVLKYLCMREEKNCLEMQALLLRANLFQKDKVEIAATAIAPRVR